MLSSCSNIQLSVPEIRLESINIQSETDELIAVIYRNRALCGRKFHLVFLGDFLRNEGFNRGRGFSNDWLLERTVGVVIRGCGSLGLRMGRSLCHFLHVPLGMKDEKSRESQYYEHYCNYFEESVSSGSRMPVFQDTFAPFNIFYLKFYK